jgi:hypothetical protein
MAISPITANGSAQTQPLNRHSAQWEYMTLSYTYSYSTTTYEINGEREVRLKNTPLHAALTLMGEQGWELVSIAGGEGKLYVFKRPAQA